MIHDRRHSVRAAADAARTSPANRGADRTRKSKAGLDLQDMHDCPIAYAPRGDYRRSEFTESQVMPFDLCLFAAGSLLAAAGLAPAVAGGAAVRQADDALLKAAAKGDKAALDDSARARLRLDRCGRADAGAQRGPERPAAAGRPGRRRDRDQALRPGRRRHLQARQPLRHADLRAAQRRLARAGLSRGRATHRRPRARRRMPRRPNSTPAIRAGPSPTPRATRPRRR